MTRVYFPDEAANESDPVCPRSITSSGGRSSPRRRAGRLRFDIHLQGDRQTVFFAV